MVSLRANATIIVLRQEVAYGIFTVAGFKASFGSGLLSNEV